MKYGTFISYAHADNIFHTNSKSGWIDYFQRSLQSFIKQFSGKELFIDSSLEPDRHFSDQLYDNLNNSATIVVVLSQAFLRSTWCSREIKHFSKVLKDRRQEGGVFVAAIDNIPHEKWPDELDGLEPLPFWTLDDDMPRQLSFELIEDKAHMIRSMNKLARLINRRLNQIDKTRSEKTPATDADAPCVFLAQVTEDLIQARGKLRDSLESEGFRTLPPNGHYSSSSVSEFECLLQDDFSKSDVFIQLLSPLTGRPLDSSTSYVQLQYELARESGLTVFQWRSKDIQIGGDVYNSVDENHQSVLFGEQVRAQALEIFEMELINYLRGMQMVPEEVRDAVNRILICAHEQDYDAASALLEELERKGFGAYIHSEDAGFNELLEEADGLLAFYGSCSPSWLGKQIWRSMKICAAQSKICGLLKFPPAPKSRLPFSMPGLIEIDCQEQFDPQRLDPFLTSVLSKKKPR